jgi:hypothetical protein
MSTTPLPHYPQQPPYYAPVNPIAGPAKVFGIIYAVFATLTLLGGLALVCIGLSANRYHTDGINAPAGAIFLLIAVFILALTLLHAITAYGLLAKKSWGRTLAIVSSFLMLLSIPIGTIFGGFALYFLLRTGAAQDYDRLTLS